jgi:SAM-dependent methyltransferase
LDVGCGDGQFLESIQVAQAQGLEFNPEAVRRARAKGLDVSDGELSSLPSGAFDVVTIFQVLEHVVDPVAILREIVRIVRPGGRVLIAVPNNDGVVGSAVQEPLNVAPHHPLRWTRRALNHLQEQFPLRLASLEEEPGGIDHLFLYRRCKVVQVLRRFFGGQLPLMTLTARTIAVRKIANVMVLASLKISRKLPPPEVPGHSYLAVYERSADD